MSLNERFLKGIRATDFNEQRVVARILNDMKLSISIMLHQKLYKPHASATAL